jgi:hypothetical protein
MNSLSSRVLGEHTVQPGNILYDGIVKRSPRMIRMCVENLLAFLRRADSGDDRMAPLQQCLEDMSGDEAATTCEEYSGHTVSLLDAKTKGMTDVA